MQQELGQETYMSIVTSGLWSLVIEMGEVVEALARGLLVQ